MTDYSSRQVARMLGLSASGLSKYIRTGKLPAPKSILAGGNTIYLWKEQDIERARKLLPKIVNGRKTRYQKKHSAVSTQQSAKPKPKIESKTKKK